MNIDKEKEISTVKFRLEQLITLSDKEVNELLYNYGPDYEDYIEKSGYARGIWDAYLIVRKVFDKEPIDE